MNVNAKLNGEDVVIVSMEKQKLTALIAYIDAQGGAGNLKITEVPLTDLPLELASNSEPIVGTCDVFSDEFLTITADWTETDAGGIAAPGANGYRHDIHSTNSAELEGNFTIGGDCDFSLQVNILSWPSGVTFSSNVYIDLGSTLILGIRGAAHVTPNTLQYYVAGGDRWSKLNSFGEVSAGVQYFRLVRVGTQITAYVWNDSSQQWEWDGDTGGNVHNDSWGSPLLPTLTWKDVNGTTDYIEGDMTEFCIDVGTKI